MGSAMRFKTKDIGPGGLEVQVTVTAAWLGEACPDLDARPGPGGVALCGHLDKSGDAFLFRGRIEGVLLVPCARCLDLAELACDLPLTVTYVERDEADADDEADDGEIVSCHGGVIDVSADLRDEILLAIPIGPLCRADCAGLCSVCGGNRNRASCDCKQLPARRGSKFAVLKDLKI